MSANIVLIVGGYLFGSLPFTAALARVSGLDLSQEKDLHIVLWHKVSKRRASLAGFVDFIKGSIPVLAGFGFNLSTAVVAFSGVAAVVGQMWPPFRNFHGEKGNSTGGRRNNYPSSDIPGVLHTAFPHLLRYGCRLKVLQSYI
jgi:glycerol-3-phosphate acyltransferase PlsY